MEFWTKKDFLRGLGYYSNRAETALEALELIKDDEIIVNFAYTDYGGDFFDKVAIEYFAEDFPDNIIWEDTSYYGKNAILFGDIVPEFIEETENYLLGFRDIEDYFYEREHEEEYKFYKWLLDDIKDEYDFDYQKALNWLGEEKGGCYAVMPSGVDCYCSELIDELVRKEIIKEKKEG